MVLRKVRENELEGYDGIDNQDTALINFAPVTVDGKEAMVVVYHSSDKEWLLTVITEEAERILAFDNGDDAIMFADILPPTLTANMLSHIRWDAELGATAKSEKFAYER